jgi:hypothetical protein
MDCTLNLPLDSQLPLAGKSADTFPREARKFLESCSCYLPCCRQFRLEKVSYTVRE